MTALELDRIASRAGVTMPAKATGFRLVTDVEPCGRLANGSPSGVVTDPDRTRTPHVRFGVAWIVDDRLTGSVIAWFDRQVDAHKLLAVLRGERPAPRSGPDLAPASTWGAVEQGQGRIEAPGSSAGVSVPGPEPAREQPSPAAVRCAHCGNPIDQPRTGRPRLTCSDACRQALRRAGAVTKRADAAEPTDEPVAAGRPGLPTAPGDSAEAPTDTTSAIPARSRDEGAEAQLALHLAPAT